MNSKSLDYTIAIKKYYDNPWYTRIEFFASIIIISLQCLTFAHLFFYHKTIHFFSLCFTLFFAYILTDFINGIVHMIVDNSAHYRSFIGPYVAAFNLHHARLVYKNNNPFIIYFNESGHKLWLVFYLLILFSAQSCFDINFYFNLGLVLIGILSSIAELSHFWCHNNKQTNAFIRLLQKHRLLLSMQHHKIHHQKDNVNYAFLNGCTDPLLNIIARYFFGGYKNYSDLYVMQYENNIKISKSQ